MAEKTASIKVTLNQRGLVSGVAAMEGRFQAAGRRMGASLGGAIGSALDRAVRAAQRIPSALKGAFNALPNGIINGLRRVESASMAMAKKIGNAFKSAFSGVFGGRGKAAGGGQTAPEGGGRGQAGGGGRRGNTLAGAASVFLGNVATKAFDVALSKGSELLTGAEDVAELANRLSISARGAGEKAVDPAELQKEFFQIAQDVRGITGEQAGLAAARFVQMTGDLKTARSSLKDFAVAASASGADMESVAGTTAAISQQFGITDPGQIRDTLAALIYQGKSGAFELKDAADLFPRLAAAGAAFGLDKGIGGVKTLGGLTQIAMTGTGKGETAATAVENLLTNLKIKSGDLKQAGVKVFEGGKTRDLPSILIEAIAKVGGKNVEKKQAGLSQIFGEQGIRAINPMVSKFNDVFRATGSTEKAMQSLRDMINSSISAPGTWADVVEDSAQAQQANSARMTASMERIKAALSTTLLPKLADFAEGLANNDEAFNAVTQALDLLVVAAEAIVGVAQMAGIIKAPTNLQRAEAEGTKAARADKNAVSIETQAETEKDAAKRQELLDKADRLRREATTSSLKAAEFRETGAQESGVALARVRSKAESVRTGETVVTRPGEASRTGTTTVERGKMRIAGSDAVLKVEVQNTVRTENQGGGPAPVMPGWAPR